MPWLINEVAAKNLREYKYVGADNSILYKYALSPLAQFMVDYFVPTWMAPNLITLIGLLVEVFSLGIVAIYCPQFVGSDSTPRWIYLVIAASLFIYQTLDNMDGKQARKTGSSSPLGLIFDHGCDAINAAFGACLMCTLFSIPSTSPIAVLCAISATSVPFYFATWEEYYVHKLILPWFNGPSEGVFGGVCCSLLSFFLGPLWWHQTLFNIPYYMFPAGFCVFGWTITIIAQTLNACRFVMSKGQSVWMPLRDLLPFCYLLFFGISWVCQTPQLLTRYPHAVVFLLFTLLAESEVALMVCHVTGMRYSPWRPVLSPLALLWANSALLAEPVVDEEAALFAYLGLTVAYFSIFAFKVVQEVRDSLGIYAFSIQPRKLPRDDGFLDDTDRDKMKKN